MDALLNPIRNADCTDRTDADAGTASAATVDIHLWQERPAGPGPKADRLLRTGIATGLAGDVVAREAAVADRNDMGKPRYAFGCEYRLRTGPRTVAAEGAFAA
ncbi:hypothetical protein ASD52_22400 [Ensifer sp. Root142]|jgi:hypothetical protein|nr:hypothetical protein ASD52_22400 [Ensifer sp. Root142]MDP9634414.1 hypothetical protein [Ensifer adhaerens]OMQ40069.1 hypothetical protein BKP54_29315 [Ensifer sp. 1H6]